MVLHLENFDLSPATVPFHLWLNHPYFLSQKKAKILWIWSRSHPSSATAHYFLEGQDSLGCYSVTVKRKVTYTIRILGKY